MAGVTRRFIGRWREVAQQMLVSIDQFVYTMVAGTLYLFGRGKVCPSPDETISSRVGRAAMDGRPWGLWWEARIDGLFTFFLAQPNHCARNVEMQFRGKAPTA